MFYIRVLKEPQSIQPYLVLIALLEILMSLLVIDKVTLKGLGRRPAEMF